MTINYNTEHLGILLILYYIGIILIILLEYSLYQFYHLY